MILNIPKRRPVTRMSVARDVLEGAGRGCSVVALIDGSASMMELVQAAAEITGPARLTLGTWTMGRPEAETVARMLMSGELMSARLIVDRSFRQFRDYYAALVEAVGVDRVVEARSHAKFATIRNDRWNMAIRGSMNANRNTRWEQVDIDDDPVIADLFDKHADTLFKEE